MAFGRSRRGSEIGRNPPEAVYGVTSKFEVSQADTQKYSGPHYLRIWPPDGARPNDLRVAPAR